MGQKNNNSQKSIKKIIKDNLELIEFRNEKQKKFFELVQNKKLVICQGPAGTAKTFMACFAALNELVYNNRIDEIIFTKPIQESGEKLGYLPGDIAEKTDPFRQSYDTNIEKILGYDECRMFLKSPYCRFEPLAYMRGATYDNAIMLLDEAQNCDLRQLILFTTRMGEDSKMIIFGDVSQYDIKYDRVGLPKIYNMVKDIHDVGVIEFGNEDIVRNELLIEITSRYEEMKEMEDVSKSKNEKDGKDKLDVIIKLLKGVL